ncbi:hypothetical protein E3Q11_02333 [Wallemia mellicola]|nr:hypothetical protein E3Q11_02333 [Wallemia mellicola]
MNLEDIRLKSTTPPPRDKVSQWHKLSFGFDRKVALMLLDAPLPPVPPSNIPNPAPELVLQPASESINQQARPVIVPSAPPTEFTKPSNPFIQHPPAPENPESPLNDDGDASSMGTERPASAIERAKDLDDVPPSFDDIPVIPSSPSKSTQMLTRNFTINDKDLRQLLTAATDQRQDKTVRDALKRAARERIEVIKQLEEDRQMEERKATEQEIPPWAQSMYELLHQTHEKLETLNIKSPEGSRVGSPSPMPQQGGIPLESIHARTFSADNFAGPTSQPMQHSNQPMVLPVGEYEPYSAPYQDPYPVIPPSHYTETQKAASTVALPAAAPVDSPPTEPALPASSPPGEEHHEHHHHVHEVGDHAATPKPVEHVDHVYIHKDDPGHTTHVIHEYVPSPPMPVAPQTTPAMDYGDENITIEGSVTPHKVPQPESSIAHDSVYHHIHHTHAHDHGINDYIVPEQEHHHHEHDHSHHHHGHDHVHQHHHHDTAPSVAPFANHPWENIRDRLNAWADLWSAHAPPTQLEVARESTHLTKYVSMIACDIFCTQVYKRWVRTIGARYPPVSIDKLFLPPSFSEVLNNAVANDPYANTCPTFRSFWNELGFEGAPKQLLTIALYRTDKYHFQILKFDLEAGILTHYDPFDAPALVDPRPKFWWRGLREAFPEARIPEDHQLQERVVAINRARPQERSDVPLAALASWRHMLVNKKPNKETDLMAVRTLIAAEIEGVQKLTDRRNKQRARKALHVHN